MTITRYPFHFGVSTMDVSGAALMHDLKDTARKAEALGYTTIFATEHIPYFSSPVPTLMAMADATTTLRVGTYVLNPAYRHPAVFASEIATLDALSNGRVELGLGAGSPFPGELEALGLARETSMKRVQKLEETVQILKGFFSQESFTFSGQHYQISKLTGSPAGVQRPHPPLHIAAGHENMLAIAARHANIITPQPPVSVPELVRLATSGVIGPNMDRQIARLRELAGKRFAEIELSMMIRSMTITDTMDQTEMDGADISYPFVGSIDQICESLYALRKRIGYSYIIIKSGDMEAFAPIVTRLTGK
jgi:probable F420-dependent oxidoreductase